MSLDGFMAGPSVSVEYPMGKGGNRLHAWLFNSHSNDVDSAVVKAASSQIGAVILGRRTFDIGFSVWGEQTPYPVPTFVVTHRDKDALPTANGSFTFVTDGLMSTVDQARAAAKDKNVAVMGGEITQALIRARAIDELNIQLVPVLLGEGLRLFNHLGQDCIELELGETIPSTEVTHLVYRLPKRAL